MAYIDGIVTTGFGQAPKVLLSELACMLAHVGTRLKHKISEFENTHEDTTPFDITRQIKYVGAIDALFAENDSTQLYELLASSDVSIVRENYMYKRPTLRAGRKTKSPVGKLLTDRTLQLQADNPDKTSSQIADRLFSELADNPNRTEDENKMYFKMGSWSDIDKNLRQTVKRHTKNVS